MRIKTYFQLIRLPNLFTAMADSLAGWLLAGGSLDDVSRWPWLVVASLAIYAGGVVLNDVFDASIDLEERPSRPIPSGRVPWRVAATLGGTLMILGLVAAWLARTRHGSLVSLALVSSVMAYDGGLKSTWFGPEVMGLCRGLNLLLGMSHHPELAGPAGWTVAIAYATFVCGITWISRSEVQPAEGTNPGIASGVILQNAALVILLAVAVHPELLPPGQPIAWWQPVAGVLALLTIGIRVNLRTIPAITTSRADQVQRAVKAGIMALVWLHVGVLLAARGPVAAASVAWLWFPALLAGRWVYST